MTRIPKPAAAIAVTLTLVASSGVALAASHASSTTITVCVSHKGGQLYKAKHCAAHDASLSWNKAGPRGAKGSPGPGDKYLLWTATASATPTVQTVGTALGVTYEATCAQSNNAVGLTLDANTHGKPLQWAVGAESTDQQGTNTGYASFLAQPASAHAEVDELDLQSSGQTSTDAGEIQQLGPDRGYLQIDDEVTSKGSNACIVTMTYFPATAGSASAVLRPSMFRHADANRPLLHQ